MSEISSETVPQPRTIDWRGMHVTNTRVPNGKAFLLAPDGQLFASDLTSGNVEPRPRAIMLHTQDVTMRLLDDGRLVVAGGMSQDGLASLVEPCENDTDRTHACPEHFVGFCKRVPSRHFETFATQTLGNAVTEGWQPSATSRGGASSTVVLAGGSVVKLDGAMSKDDEAHLATMRYSPWPKPVIEASDATGQHWRELPPRSDIQTTDASCIGSEPRRVAFCSHAIHVCRVRHFYSCVRAPSLSMAPHSAMHVCACSGLIRPHCNGAW